jgi:alpha-glucosidase (family GH31 glycosyl hydrolase)
VYFDGYEECVLNYVSIGGQTEMYFFLSGTAQDVIKEYTKLVGKSTMPPMAGLGVFQVFNGEPEDEAIAMVNKRLDLGIPTEGYLLSRVSHTAKPLDPAPLEDKKNLIKHL